MFFRVCCFAFGRVFSRFPSFWPSFVWWRGFCVCSGCSSLRALVWPVPAASSSFSASAVARAPSSGLPSSPPCPLRVFRWLPALPLLPCLRVCVLAGLSVALPPLCLPLACSLGCRAGLVPCLPLCSFCSGACSGFCAGFLPPGFLVCAGLLCVRPLSRAAGVLLALLPGSLPCFRPLLLGGCVCWGVVLCSLLPLALPALVVWPFLARLPSCCCPCPCAPRVPRCLLAGLAFGGHPFLGRPAPSSARTQQLSQIACYHDTSNHPPPTHPS